MRIRATTVAVTIAIALASLASSGGAGDARIVELRERAPGLALGVQPVRTKEGSLERDVLPVRMLTLHVERGEPATPFVEPGAFRAEWRGILDVPRRDDYVFAFEGSGAFTLEIDGEVVLDGPGRRGELVRGEKVRLRKGDREIVARYRTPLSGSADLRVFWESRHFVREPIPPTVLFHDGTAEDVTAGRLRRAGRMLVATHRCTACHATDATGMPELAMRGPNLSTAGARLAPAWLHAWIQDPHALRPHARMPQVLQGSAEERSRDAADLTAFVATLGAELEIDAAPGDATAGARLWADLGCFACHDFEPSDEPAWMPLQRVAAKFEPGAIAAFLLDPRAHDPWIRMPDLKLTAEEARHLEAYLRSRSDTTLPAAPAGDPARGRERFGALGCAQCHEAGVPALRRARPLAELCKGDGFDRGCTAATDDARGAAPDFRFDDGERAALRAFAGVGPASLTRDVPREFAWRQIEEQRCGTCHVIDGETSTWTQREHLLPAFERPEAEPSEGAHELVEVAQLRPALTWVGEKLDRAWLERFLRGDEPSPRPWLRARMPELSDALAAGLAEGLAASHGLGAEPPPEPPDRALVLAGRPLIEQQGGFGCVTCHAVGERKPVALFEVQGIDFARVADRLREEWYLRWMMDPPRYEEAAKMPKYAGDDGKTPMDAFGGDARRQFEAIWHFIRGARELR